MRSPTGAQHSIPRDSRPSARTSDHLSQPQPARQPRTSRADGWTPERIRTFLDTLAECGVVADAARAAGMSVQGAYAFRNSARGCGFDAAWRAALLLARRRLEDEVMSRALHGCVEVIIRDGEVWGERHRFDNRLTMAVLTRLDAMADSPRQLDDGPRRIAHEFEAFVDSVCAGGDAAAEFLRSRTALPFRAFDEAQIADRNAAYVHAREQGIDVEWGPPLEVRSDADAAAMVSAVGPEPDHKVPEQVEVSASDDGDSEADPPQPGVGPCQHIDPEVEIRSGAGKSAAEWQPSISSTLLDREPLSGPSEPGVGTRPPGMRTAAPHSHRANRVQPAARVKSCVARNGEAANAAGRQGRVRSYGAPG